MIYFVTAEGSENIKIGTSEFVKDRLVSLQRSIKAKVTLLGVMPGGKKEEREMHKRFAQFREHGEWFKPDASIRSIIEEMTTMEVPENPRPGTRTYMEFPDELWKAVSKLAKKNGHTVAAQVRIILASSQDVKKEAAK